MPNYAHVENDQIQRLYDVVPTAWRNVSGLDKLSDEELVDYGWYRIQKQDVSFDAATHYATYDYSYDSADDVVRETTVIHEKVAPSIEEAKPAFLRFLREVRNEKLAETDFTQLADVVARSTPEQNQAWADYRQALRDLPEQYATNDVINIQNVEWPSKPE